MRPPSMRRGRHDINEDKKSRRYISKFAVTPRNVTVIVLIGTEDIAGGRPAAAAAANEHGRRPMKVIT